jgi:hypothetical protein
VSDFDIALSVALGIGLAAATGFRIFLPMLVVSVAANTGHLHLADSFAWLGTPQALILLGVAALAEILGYYIPGIDNLLDTLSTPAALVAGTVISAAVITDLPPMVKWATTIIAGGGTRWVAARVDSCDRRAADRAFARRPLPVARLAASAPPHAQGATHPRPPDLGK